MLVTEGEMDFDGACAALEAQFEEADEALRSASGRLSALHYRQKSKDLLEQVARTGSLAETDLPWLLMADANALYDAGAFGPGGAIIRDVSRFAGALRGAGDTMSPLYASLLCTSVIGPGRPIVRHTGPETAV